MKHTIVLSGDQFTRSIPLSKRVAKIKNQAGSFVFDQVTLQVNLGDKSGGVWTSLLNLLFHHVWGWNSTMRRCCFNHTDLGRNLFFFALFKPIILQFFTILRDKLLSLNFQDDRSTRFLCTTNCSIDHIIKRFHEENSIMPGLFS